MVPETTGLTSVDIINSGIIQADAAYEAQASIVRNSIPSGFVTLGELDYDYMINNENVVKLKSESVAYVNGYEIRIPAGTTIDIGKAPEKDSREDLLFLEVWKQTPDQEDHTSGVTGIPYKLNYHNTEVRWRIRHVADVDFNKFPEGFALNDGMNWGLAIKGQGGNTTPNDTYIIVESSQQNISDRGLYISGDKSDLAKQKLKTLDGYVYAIPMFKLYRKPSCGKVIPFEYQKINPKVDYSKFAELMKEERVERVVSETIQGQSLVNLVPPFSNSAWRKPEISNVVVSAESSTVSITKSSTTVAYSLALGRRSVPIVKPSTLYTVIAQISENTLSGSFGLVHTYNDVMIAKTGVSVKMGVTGLVKGTFTTVSSFDGENGDRFEINIYAGTTGKVVIKDYMILEGDWTNKPLPKYFTGLKSVGEDESLITVKNSILNESSYDPSTGTPKLNTVSGTNYISSDNLLMPTIEGQVKRGEAKVSDLTSFGKVGSLVGDEILELTKIKGRTLQNLLEKTTRKQFNGYVYQPITQRGINLIKPSTTYTILVKGSATLKVSEIYFGDKGDSSNNLLPRTNSLIAKFTTPSTLPNLSSYAFVTYNTNENFVSGDENAIDFIMLEGDYTSTPLEQIPFIEGIKSVGENENNKVVVKRTGKNLFSAYDKEFTTSFKDTNIPDSIDVSDYVKNLIGVTVPPEGLTFKADIIANNHVELKSGFHYGLDIHFKFEDGTDAWSDFTRPILNTHGSGVISKRVTFNLSSVANKKIVGFFGKPNIFTRQSSGIFTMKNIEIILGNDTSESTAPYKEYKQEITLKEPLRSLPNGVCDTIEGNKVIRRIGKIIFDGSEYWSKTGFGGHDTQNTFEFSIPAGSADTGTAVRGISDRFPLYKVTNIPKDGGFRIARSNGGDYFLFSPPVSLIPYRDTSAWTTWLSQNPVTVYYELANPVEELIEPNYDKESIKTYQLDEPLRALPNGVKDEIVGNKLIRRCRELLIDKNIKILDVINTTSFDNYNLCQVRIPEAKNIETDSISSILSTLPLCRIADRANVGYMNNLCVVKGNDGILRIQLLVAKTITTDVEFRTWLESNPVKVIYELATPIEIPLKEVLPSQANFSLARQFNYTDNYLLELPNGVKDTVENNKVVRRVKKVVLNGSENWIDSTDGTTVQRFCTDDLGLKNNGDTVVNVFANIPTYTRTELYNSDLFGISSALSTGNYSKSVVVGIESSKLSANTIQAFKTWLSQNPITIMFELATPTTEELSGNNNRYVPYHKEDNTYCGSLYVGNGTNDTITDTTIKSESVIINTPFRESTGKLVVNDCKYKKSSEGYSKYKMCNKSKNLVPTVPVYNINYTSGASLDRNIVTTGSPLLEILHNTKDGVVVNNNTGLGNWGIALMDLPIYVKKNTVYTVSVNHSSIKTLGFSGRVGLGVYDMYGVRITSVKELNVTSPGSGSKLAVTFNTRESELIRLGLGVYSGEIVVFNNLQLEEGSSPTTYEPGVYSESSLEIIERNDIYDLRHQVSLSGFDYEQLLNESFDKLLRGEL